MPEKLVRNRQRIVTDSSKYPGLKTTQIGALTITTDEELLVRDALRSLQHYFKTLFSGDVYESENIPKVTEDPEFST